ncbi:hypothetical protein ACJIZ3_020838 [Penstemon smallii]|uniref:Glycosyltransferase 61 catalytic domain-containing protein n=1 Tax=Penstemon smallii TaxID=265156 RepID=A0ABD3SJQ9_9LAMI
MYDPIFAKSFTKYERKRFGFCALILSLIIALSICSIFKPHLHPLSVIGDAFDLQLSINAVEDMIINDDTVLNYEPKVNNAAENLPLSITSSDNTLSVNDTSALISESIGSNAAENLPLSITSSENTLIVNDTSTLILQPIVKKITEPICRTLEGGADYCDIEGDIRVEANSSTIFVVTNDHESISNSTNSWSIQPYPRKGIAFVKHWTVKLVRYDDVNIPKCTQNHRTPAILFSIGGYSGNHFHDFADLLFPLYTTSFHYKREVHFLASDYKSWWVPKFPELLNKLTKHEILDIDREKAEIHCYNKIVAGLKFQRELIMDQSSLMHNFRQLLRETYSLERKKTVRTRKGDGRKPRLMIISRKRTRILTNEGEVSKVAKKLGFEVVLAEAGVSTNLRSFAQMVNSCDVLMGIHGAGLTNMVFLPDNAILVQLVPLGGIDIFARLDFGNPASGMNIRYMEYKIATKESSLSRRYSIDDLVLKDPMSFHRKGWETLRSVYLDNQNVTIDIRRFKGTLVKALKLIRH